MGGSVRMALADVPFGQVRRRSFDAVVTRLRLRCVHAHVGDGRSQGGVGGAPGSSASTTWR